MPAARFFIILATMRLTLALLFFYALGLKAQDGCHFEYRVKNTLGDTSMHLTVFTKNGNSLNLVKSDTAKRIFSKSVTQKDQPEYNFYYMGDGYTKTNEHTKTDVQEFEEYRLSLLGKDTIDKRICTKVSLEMNDRMAPVIVWIRDDIKPDEGCPNAQIFLINLNKFHKALKKINLSGFPVKIDCETYVMTSYEFKYAEKVNVPDSYFMVRVVREGYSSDYLKRQNMLNDEKYKVMKEQEEAAKRAIQGK